MKFGEHLQAQLHPEWREYYLDYNRLKGLIKELATSLADRLDGGGASGGIGTSMSIPRPTNAAAQPSMDVSHESFYNILESEMRKIDKFTTDMIDSIRTVLLEVEAKIGTHELSHPSMGDIRVRVDNSAQDFLKLEKYVNLNFTGFHKILKKHDKRLPNPCKAFYLARLHEQAWMRDDHSDLIVKMSSLYSTLRGDEEVQQVESEKQDFVRSTTKYWVHTEDISRVKYIILQHLPVFLQESMDGETDSQLVNSVYLDNYAMELYHGRLDKTPNAIALRMRWYGTGEPETVFVERKTHREAWAGELSVKERFTVSKDRVQDILEGQFDVDYEAKIMRERGKSEAQIKDWLDLAREITQVINAKQLSPTMRTQYMRTAFQIPFDATVRVSLDTNLCMITERVPETREGLRWYRDPTVPVPAGEITRFPHAVLEVKLQLEDENACPQWVTDLINGGMLMQVHKFSKFIHGSAVLLPEDVRSVPYWIDDSTLAPSIMASGAQELLSNQTVGANEHYEHLLPHTHDGKRRNPPNSASEAMAASSTFEAVQGMARAPYAASNMDILEEEREAEGAWESITYCLSRIRERIFGEGGFLFCFDCSMLEVDDFTMNITPQKVEPKLFFANERTYIKYMHMGVMISSFSIGVLAFTDNSDATWYAMMMLPVSLCFVLYALNTYLWRSNLIRSRNAHRWDDPMGPVILTLLLTMALIVQFVDKLQKVFYDVEL